MSFRIALSAALLILGCSAAGAQTSHLNDAQIASIFMSANQADVDAGKVANEWGHQKEVRVFGHRMRENQSDLNRSTTELLDKLHMKPESTATSESLKKNGEEMVTSLREHDKGGAAFDKDYIDHEVSYQQSMLNTLDHTLIPNAKNPELKQLLEKARPAYTSQLNQARQLQSEIDRSGNKG